MEPGEPGFSIITVFLEDIPMIVHGEDVYRVYIVEDKILYDHINLDTREQSVGHALFTFEASEIRELRFLENSFIAVSDDTLYLFDNQLNPVKYVARPPQMPDEKILSVFNRQLTQMVYAEGDNLYLLDLGQNVPPRLLYTHTYSDVYGPEWVYPVRLLEDGRIFIGVSWWTSRAIRYMLLNQSGEILAEINWHVGMSGGFSASNSAGAFFSGWGAGGGGRQWEYFDFSTLELKEFDNLPFTPGEGFILWALNSHQNPHVWYFIEPRGSHTERGWVTDETLFYKMDFESGIFIELPLVVSDAMATMIAVSESGRFLFSYEHNDERGFVVYTPDNSSS